MYNIFKSSPEWASALSDGRPIDFWISMNSRMRNTPMTSNLTNDSYRPEIMDFPCCFISDGLAMVELVITTPDKSAKESKITEMSINCGNCILRADQNSYEKVSRELEYYVLMKCLPRIYHSFVCNAEKTGQINTGTNHICFTLHPSCDQNINNIVTAPKFRRGNLDDFKNWVYDKYPKYMMDTSPQKIKIEFSIDSTGKVVDVVKKECDNPEIFEEVSKIIWKSPKWTAAKSNGQSIKYKYTTTFVL